MSKSFLSKKLNININFFQSLQRVADCGRVGDFAKEDPETWFEVRSRQPSWRAASFQRRASESQVQETRGEKAFEVQQR